MVGGAIESFWSWPRSIIGQEAATRCFRSTTLLPLTEHFLSLLTLPAFATQDLMAGSRFRKRSFHGSCTDPSAPAPGRFSVSKHCYAAGCVCAAAVRRSRFSLVVGAIFFRQPAPLPRQDWILADGRVAASRLAALIVPRNLLVLRNQLPRAIASSVIVTFDALSPER